MQRQTLPKLPQHRVILHEIPPMIPKPLRRRRILRQFGRISFIPGSIDDKVLRGGVDGVGRGGEDDEGVAAFVPVPEARGADRGGGCVAREAGLLLLLALLLLLLL